MQRGNGAVIGKQNTPTTSVATGVWALNEVQRAVLGGNWPASTIVDPYFENVSLLLHGNGTNGAQNNTFLDSSTNNFTITRNGNTTQGAFTPYGANWSNYFDGTGDYLNPPNDSANSFGTGDFTVEAWIYPTSTSSASIVSNRGAGGADTVLTCAFSTANGLFLHTQNTAVLNTGTNVTANTWQHVAFVRASGTLKIYLNGVSVGSASMTQNLSSTNALYIAKDGTKNDGGETGLFSGYISNTRIVKGTAVYTANFTPPTAPLTAITNTSLLTCQSNRFIDNSSNNFTITRNGDVSVQRFSPFNPTAAYSAATIGGSGYFDGSGDWVQTPSSANLGLGTGNFTIEFWYYANPSQGSRTVLVGNSLGFTTNAWNIQINNASPSISNRLQLWAYNLNSSGIVIQGGTTLVPNTWYHVALVRNGNTFTFYLNGVSDGTATNTASLDGGGANSISVARDGTDYFAGYMTDVRILKGTAQYTSTFTPPTSPLTAITNTQLLTNFTNGGIIDNAMMNDLETVGNAQISTSVSKFGGGSMAFDGSGDILSSPGSQNYVFNGDFTVEGWVYIDSTMASSRPDNLKSFIFVGWNTGNTPQLYVYGTTSTAGVGLGYYDGTTAWEVAATVPKDQWVHIAFARTGSALYGFVNGTRYTINASISATIGSANTFVVGGNPNQVSAYYSYLKGYIDDLRITKGYARYTANFTAPTAPFPDQ